MLTAAEFPFEVGEFQDHVEVVGSLPETAKELAHLVPEGVVVAVPNVGQALALRCEDIPAQWREGDPLRIELRIE